jgi:hypothetical protein
MSNTVWGVVSLIARGLMASTLGLVQAIFPSSMLVVGLRTIPDSTPDVCLHAPVGVIFKIVELRSHSHCRDRGHPRNGRWRPTWASRIDPRLASLFARTLAFGERLSSCNKLCSRTDTNSLFLWFTSYL